MAESNDHGRGERRRFWCEQLSDFEAAGGTVSDFCRQRGLSPASFYQWRKKLSSEKANPAASLPAGFIDLGELALAAGSGRLEIRLDFGGGLVLQVVRG